MKATSTTWLDMDMVSITHHVIKVSVHDSCAPIYHAGYFPVVMTCAAHGDLMSIGLTKRKREDYP